jgi:ribonuclease III
VARALSNSFHYVFKNPALLQQALRHRSAGTPHNERLEFLGDALVNLMVAQSLFEVWPKADEGALTRARASMVRESSLATIARQLGLGEKLELGQGESKTGGHRRDSILADALEALVAAVHLDAGFETCRAVVLPWFAEQIHQTQPGKVEKDPKTRLQEWLQARQFPRPDYQLLQTHGEDHARSFVVRCITLQPSHQAEGEGNSLRLAEMSAAEKILLSIELSEPSNT